MLNDVNGANVAKAQAAGDSITLDVEGQRFEFGPEDLLVETTAAPGFASAESEGFLVALDTELTPALETEGLAREMVRTVQEARKTTGLQISDRIALGIQGSPAIDGVLTAYRDYIMSETLATTWLENEAQDAANSVSHQLEQHRWFITIEKVN
jgi:isoleucyl-tRNA synthetase